MTGTTRVVACAVVLAVGLAMAHAGTAVAGQQGAPRLADRQLRDLVTRIDDRAGTFRSSLRRADNRSQIEDSRWNGEFNPSVMDFTQSTRRLRDRVNARQSGTLDAEDVLRRAASIDSVMQRYQLSAQAEQAWLSMRADLNELARAYDIGWNWNRGGYRPAPDLDNGGARLTGTYQLETVRGDDPRRAAEVAVRNVPADRRQLTYQRLLARLEAPEEISIERNQNSVTMASTSAPRVTFDADGREQAEQWSPGRTMNTRATLQGDQLVVVTTGYRGSAFSVTFDPIANGGGLQMTRTIDDEGLSRPVTVRNFYRRTSMRARWDIDTHNENTPSPVYPARDGAIVPDGTTFVATLDNWLSTTNAREGDLFTLTTRSPSQFEGAVIRGSVFSVNGSGRMTGRAGLTLDFQSIQLRDGRSYDFDGVIEAVRMPGGETVRVDREGAIDSRDSQGQKTMERSAIGAALGALIGAVTGGGKGAAIGAAIGAGGGAGSVIIEGRDRLDLQRGTEVTITSTVPFR